MTSNSDSESAALQPDLHVIPAQVHGRYLVRPARDDSAAPLLVGFHGYAEDASDHLAELVRIPGTGDWHVVSVQALHPFYTKQQRVVASWMTRLDREQAIADNVAHVERVVADVRARYRTREELVFSGFSQGGAMAYRAAAHIPSQGLIILASDVPPDVAAPQAGTRMTLPRVLIGRGIGDEWYTGEKQAADTAALDALGTRYELCVFDGAHEWTDAFRAAAADVLRTTHEFTR